MSAVDVSRPRSSDSGFTLIELLAYMSLLVVVLLIVGGLLVNSLASQRTVRTSTQASNSGQLVAQSVAQGVRNATAIKVTTPSAGTQVLTVLTASMTTPRTWLCQAWYFSGAEVRTRTSNTLIPASSFSNWTLLGTDMRPVSGWAVFTPTPTPTVLNPTPTPSTSNPLGVILTLDVKPVNGQSVRISSTSTSLQPLPVPVPVTGLVGSPCF
ncbi:hypothetical protein E3O47_09455 [Cryobacterium sp. TMT2-17-1]|uniref:prepilin-type N-terminal cleavage/methylation domain-containing protein n=1 Tax=Cryobacterium sp. TMT2-17-1 TaxID=1259248 RepID=UPI00106A4315|nr:prepilin-type N-terminal cleavage/methylation domain-containing protein [Cryobacterium sp. TMT2-17-1]TFC49900.1 hypothetical protein E3O47_09455 [Cryobacterium sp. TMT2-17-1]